MADAVTVTREMDRTFSGHVVSIFDTFTTSEKTWSLRAGSLVALITPFTDTVYLPALSNVGLDLHASTSDVAATVSAYMGAIGMGQLFWGPLSDYFGRLSVLYATMFCYLLLTIACFLSPDIITLIIFRTLQGFFVGCTIVSVQAVIADMYAPEERGTAMGSFLAPMLIGPVIAPLVGGALSDAFTWRSTFYLLLAMGVVITAFAWFNIPETHHYYASLRHPQFAGKIAKPILISPFKAIYFLIDPELNPHYCVMASTFAGMFTTLTILPSYLALAPYSLSPTIIGVCFLPVGVSMLVGALVGGTLSDKAGMQFSRHPSGRLVYGMAGAYLNGISCIAFGISLQYQAPLSVVLIMQSLVGFGQAAYMPSNMGYLSTVRQSAAAAAGAISLFTCFAAAAVSISVSVILSDIIGIAWYFVILAALVVISSSWVCFKMYVDLMGTTESVPVAIVEV